MKTMLGVIGVSLLLAGCGGGGGASVVAEWLGTNPNAVVTTKSGATYDLRNGTQDPYAAKIVEAIFGPNGTNATFTSSEPNQFLGHMLTGQSSPTSGFTISTPSDDVKAAWRDGWTGLGQNVLMVDGYPDPIHKPSWLTDAEYKRSYTHGITTAMLVGRYAIQSGLYTIDGNNDHDGKIHDGNSDNYDIAAFEDNSRLSHPALVNSTRKDAGFYFDVINISMGYNYWERSIKNPTQVQIDDAFARQSSWTNFIARTLDGTDVYNFGTAGSSAVFMTDAVVAKAAMNDSIDTRNDPLSYTLAHNSQISPRLLIVGALDTNGEATYVNQPGTATIADYSNVAGSDPNIQNRFLVAFGHTPYTSTDLAIDGVNIKAGTGTSYAAPRVAGYAAIVRQKFPNLTAANTADILLQTARYDTLSCNPKCDKAIYGWGEASLSHALAPFGALH